MILTGDTINNPVTGERVTFLATSADTDGDAVVIETVVQPGGFVAAAHVHPAQSERFAVAAGQLGLKVGRKKMKLGPGEVANVEAGTGSVFGFRIPRVAMALAPSEIAPTGEAPAFVLRSRDD